MGTNKKQASLQWRDQRAATHATAVLARLQKVLAPTEDGRVKLGLGNDYDLGISAIASFARFSSELPANERRRIAAHSILEVRKRGRLTHEPLLAEMAVRQGEYLRKPKTNYLLLSSLSVRFDGRVRQRSPFGTVHRFYPSRPPQLVLPDRVKQEWARDQPAGFTYVVTEVSARDHRAAADLAIDHLDAMRAIWNLWYGYRRITKSIGRWRRPRNAVVYGPFHTLHLSTGEPATDTYWFERWRAEAGATITLDQIERLRLFERWIVGRLRRTPMEPATVRVLTRFVRALDETDHAAGFLKLWAVLEELTGSSRMKYEATIRRASFIFKDQDYHVAVLEHLRTWRNRMVHEGAEADEAEDFVNQLKAYVEELLLFALTCTLKFLP